MTRSLDSAATLEVPAGLAGLDIAGLTADSRTVKPGYLFAALPGAKVDGAGFIGDAVRRGAVAVVAPLGTKLDAETPAVALIEDPLPRRRFARMAAAFHGTQPETIVAVTGTSGKSSTVSFVRQIWRSLGENSASLGTLGLESDALTRYGTLTTADPVELHADLAALATAGVTHVAMEASSHGLDQYRMDGVRVAAAGFTSFGRDHLDYHLTSRAYLDAKVRLFTEVLRPGGVAVLNADIPEFEQLEDAAKAAGRRVISYGARGRELQISQRIPTATGEYVMLRVQGGNWDFTLPLAGGFQVMNALCALCLAVATGIEDLSSIQRHPKFAGMIAALKTLQGVRGRLERVATLPNGASVYVDYAHKPDALIAVLDALRDHAKRKLVVAFGCGGDRDAGKRPLMGSIAARLADTVIVTDDNPRGEDPAAIRAAVLSGSPGAFEIGDRAQAIEAGIRALQTGDVFIIAGKGHEQGQIVGTDVRPFDDAAVARRIVAEITR